PAVGPCVVGMRVRGVQPTRTGGALRGGVLCGRLRSLLFSHVPGAVLRLGAAAVEARQAAVGQTDRRNCWFDPAAVAAVAAHPLVFAEVWRWILEPPRPG